MNYDEFKDQLLDALERELEEYGYKLMSGTVLRNNGHRVDTISIVSETSNVAPVLYPEQYYDAYLMGQKFATCVSQAKELALKNHIAIWEMPKLSRELLEEKMDAVIINARANEELLSETPHRIIEDLAIIPKVHVGKSGDTDCTFRLTNQHLAILKMTKEEVMQIAIANTEKQKFDCVTMEEITIQCIKEVFGENAEELMEEVRQVEQAGDMYVLTNKGKTNGAIAMACKEVMEQAVQKVGEDCYILPASIHEVILVPKSKVNDVQDLKEMVYEVNRKEVMPEEILSDNVYQYDLKTKKLSIANGEKLEEIVQATKSVCQRR